MFFFVKELFCVKKTIGYGNHNHLWTHNKGPSWSLQNSWYPREIRCLDAIKTLYLNAITIFCVCFKWKWKQIGGKFLTKWKSPWQKPYQTPHVSILFQRQSLNYFFPFLKKSTALHPLNFDLTAIKGVWKGFLKMKITALEAQGYMRKGLNRPTRSKNIIKRRTILYGFLGTWTNKILEFYVVK